MAATTTTYGYKLPSNGDRDWYANLNFNTSRIDAHTHNGTDSPLLPTSNFTKGTSTIAAGSWSAVAGQAGTFQQTVTLPSGYFMTSIAPTFIINSGPSLGNVIYPSIEWISTTSYKIYINDNTLALKAIYA